MILFFTTKYSPSFTWRVVLQADSNSINAEKIIMNDRRVLNVGVIFGPKLMLRILPRF